MKSKQMKWYIVCDFLQNDTSGRAVGWNNDESQSAWEVFVIYLFIYKYAYICIC